MQRYTVYLCLETALQVSGGTSTHHQERKQLYLQHPVLVTPLLLPAAIAVRPVTINKALATELRRIAVMRFRSDFANSWGGVSPLSSTHS